MKTIVFIAICIGLLHTTYAVTECYNNGVLSGSTCTCQGAFRTGPNCQLYSDPADTSGATGKPCDSNLDSKLTCPDLDCYATSTTLSQFFGCNRKCLCCENKKCYNGGTLTSGCACECFGGADSIWDPASNCQNIASGKTCVDNTQCAGGQFGNPQPNCNIGATKWYCPKACGLCT